MGIKMTFSYHCRGQLSNLFFSFQKSSGWDNNKGTPDCYKSMNTVNVAIGVDYIYKVCSIQSVTVTCRQITIDKPDWVAFTQLQEMSNVILILLNAAGFSLLMPLKDVIGNYALMCESNFLCNSI